MKRIIYFGVVLAAVLLFVRAIPNDSEGNDKNKGIVFFDGTWEEALALAQKEDKLIFLDAYASWCGPCRMMSWRVFTDDKVGVFFNEKFINVKMDMEKGEGPTLSQQYRVIAYPSLFFIDSDGKVKQTVIGYHSAEQLIEIGEKIAH